MEKALENTVIADKFMKYRLTLKSFLKMNFNMEKIAIKYRFPIFYMSKDKFSVIFVIVAVLFAKNKKNVMVINFLILLN